MSRRARPCTRRAFRGAAAVAVAVLKNAVSTWQAYNTWGGHDLYLGPGGSYADRALAVTLDRPYDQSGAFLFLVYERKLINLAERIGLPLADLTSLDLATDSRALDGASALVSPGHDEYWTPAERGYVTAARAAADGPAAARYPARDNLRELDEWPGDPIAARHNQWG